MPLEEFRNNTAEGKLAVNSCLRSVSSVASLSTGHHQSAQSEERKGKVGENGGSQAY